MSVIPTEFTANIKVWVIIVLINLLIERTATGLEYQGTIFGSKGSI